MSKFSFNRNSVLISDLWKDRRAVLAFARHFGFGALIVLGFLMYQDRMDALGVALVLIDLIWGLMAMLLTVVGLVRITTGNSRACIVLFDFLYRLKQVIYLVWAETGWVGLACIGLIVH
ncbi:putative peroxiredoxin-like 2A/B/C [Helianthus anomalus]